MSTSGAQRLQRNPFLSRNRCILCLFLHSFSLTMSDNLDSLTGGGAGDVRRLSHDLDMNGGRGPGVAVSDWRCWSAGDDCSAPARQCSLEQTVDTLIGTLDGTIQYSLEDTQHGGDLTVPRSGPLTVSTRSRPRYLGWGLAPASVAPVTGRGCSHSLRCQRGLLLRHWRLSVSCVACPVESEGGHPGLCGQQCWRILKEQCFADHLLVKASSYPGEGL